MKKSHLWEKKILEKNLCISVYILTSLVVTYELLYIVNCNIKFCFEKTFLYNVVLVQRFATLGFISSLLNLKTLISHWTPIGHVLFYLVVSSHLFKVFFFFSFVWPFLSSFYRNSWPHEMCHEPWTLIYALSGVRPGLYRGDSCVFWLFSSAVSAVSYCPCPFGWERHPADSAVYIWISLVYIYYEHTVTICV